MDNGGGPPPPRPPGPIVQRFQAANTTNDGKLTLDQAQAAHMIGIVQNFSVIDADHKGYITLQDIGAWMAARRAGGIGQMGPTGAPPPPGPQ